MEETAGCGRCKTRGRRRMTVVGASWKHLTVAAYCVYYACLCRVGASNAATLPPRASTEAFFRWSICPG